MANPTTRATLVMSIISHWARLLTRAAHAPYSLPCLTTLRRARFGANSRFQLEEALKLPSGIRRSSTPKANLDGAGENKIAQLIYYSIYEISFYFIIVYLKRIARS